MGPITHSINIYKVFNFYIYHLHTILTILSDIKSFSTKGKTLYVTTVKFGQRGGERARYALTVRKFSYFLKAKKSSRLLCSEGRTLMSKLRSHLHFSISSSISTSFPPSLSLSLFVLDLKKKCPSSLPK